MQTWRKGSRVVLIPHRRLKILKNVPSRQLLGTGMVWNWKWYLTNFLKMNFGTTLDTKYLLQYFSIYGLLDTTDHKNFLSNITLGRSQKSFLYQCPWFTRIWQNYSMLSVNFFKNYQKFSIFQKFSHVDKLRS